MTRIEEIRARLDKATPGPWYWRNTSPTNVLLLGPMSRAVMAFARSGMQGAQPQFRGDDGLLHNSARANICDFADADLIANAPDDIRWLLDALARRDARCEDLAAQLDDARRYLLHAKRVEHESTDVLHTVHAMCLHSDPHHQIAEYIEQHDHGYQATQKEH